MKMLRSLAIALAMCLALSACSGGGSASSSASASGSAGQSGFAGSANSSQSDLAYVQDKGTLVVGMTDFAPMDYKQAGSDEWIGFDADMAKLFAESLGVSVEFMEINWDMKAMELDNKGIDVVWNGMTITDEVKGLMSVSEPYCLNAQVVVVPADKAAQYQDLDSLKGLRFAAENGSAGAAQLDKLGISYTATDTQGKALLEVASGASDACVIDLLMAGAMIGEGTDYANLTYTLNLNTANGEKSEEYGVGFRQGSDLVGAFNTFWKNAYDAGTVMETAVTYGVQESIVQK